MAETGDCFEVAAHYALDAYLGQMDTTEMYVVHGMPTGTGRHNLGRRFWHAWIEIGDVVIDRSNGANFVIRREEYYSIGQITEDKLWRYTVLEAAAEMREWEHYGPWVAGWESMKEV